MNDKLVRELHDLADRGRSGDQNALALIEEVRKNAFGGLAKAQESLRILMAYMQANPVRSVAVGAETAAALGALKTPGLDPQNILRILCFLPHSGDPGSLEAACVILANGPPMSAARIAGLDAQVIAPCKPPFHFGLESSGQEGLFGSDGAPPPDPTTAGYLCAGHCLGMARKIQQVRGGAPLAMLSPEIGWEMALRRNGFSSAQGHQSEDVPRQTLPPPGYHPNHELDPRTGVDPRQGLEVETGFVHHQGFPGGQFYR